MKLQTILIILVVILIVIWLLDKAIPGARIKGIPSTRGRAQPYPLGLGNIFFSMGRRRRQVDPPNVWADLNKRRMTSIQRDAISKV